MRFRKPLYRPLSFFNNNNKLYIIPFKHTISDKNIFSLRNYPILNSSLVSLFTINKNIPNLSSVSISTSEKKLFKIICSIIKGEIILAEGFNILLQHVFFHSEKSSCKNTILLKIPYLMFQTIY